MLGLVASAVDVTERENALKRLALLDTVRARVGRRLDVLAVCRELVDAVVPAFTGIAVVEVIEDVVRGEDPPLVPVDQDVPLHRTAFRGRISAYRVGDVRPLPSGTPTRTYFPTSAHGSSRSTLTARGSPPTQPERTPSGGPMSTL